MSTIAELLCQRCGAISHTELPSRRTEAVRSGCACGGLRQTVRIRHIRTPEFPVRAGGLNAATSLTPATDLPS
jgi:hypothetical protein